VGRKNTLATLTCFDLVSSSQTATDMTMTHFPI